MDAVAKSRLDLDLEVRLLRSLAQVRRHPQIQAGTCCGFDRGNEALFSRQAPQEQCEPGLGQAELKVAYAYGVVEETGPAQAGRRRALRRGSLHERRQPGLY